MGDSVALGMVVKILKYRYYSQKKWVTHSRFFKNQRAPTHGGGAYGANRHLRRVGVPRQRRRAAFGPATVPDRSDVGKWLAMVVVC